MAFDFGNANEAQRSAISTTDGPLLIIAGPGTGKTYTLVKRIVYLITEKDVLPEEIMIATFTEKAAKELITRITNELYAIGVSVNLNEMYIGTFHSICLRILKDHLEYTRIKKNYRMLDNFDQQYMVFQKINRFRNLPYFDVIFDKKQGAWRQAGEIVKYVNNLAEELVDIDEMQEDSDEHIVAVANIMKQYNILMEDENLIDFSSIQTEAYKLLIEEPSILEEIQQKIKYVMVDEYQDTNYIQELLVFLIAGKNRNICVVGDDDQGLYRFRGATIRNILEFPGHFAEGECKQVKLVTNYRSERQIIDFYNKWMSTTDGRAYDFMWKNFRFEKKIVPPEGKKDAKVGVIKCSGKDLLDDWYEQVYSFITQLKSSGVLTDYNQIAVLCKSVKGDKIIGMVEYLEEHGIKVYSPRSEMFFERKEIKQVIGCMILCFPEYVRKLQQRDFSYDFENLYKYYDTQCIAAARELILQYRDTLGKWIAEKMHKHANLRKDNADYAFTGLSEYAEILLQKYPELKDNYTYKKDFYTDLVSYLDHGFMIMQPRNPYLENMRIQRQKGCLYVCGVKFETPIDKMRTSVNAGNNILCPHEPEAPKELDGGNFLVKVVIPARLKNVIMKQLEEKGITKEALLPM